MSPLGARRPWGDWRGPGAPRRVLPALLPCLSGASAFLRAAPDLHPSPEPGHCPAASPSRACRRPFFILGPWGWSAGVPRGQSPAGLWAPPCSPAPGSWGLCLLRASASPAGPQAWRRRRLGLPCAGPAGGSRLWAPVCWAPVCLPSWPLGSVQGQFVQWLGPLCSPLCDPGTGVTVSSALSEADPLEGRDVLCIIPLHLVGRSQPRSVSEWRDGRGDQWKATQIKLGEGARLQLRGCREHRPRCPRQGAQRAGSGQQAQAGLGGPQKAPCPSLRGPRPRVVAGLPAVVAPSKDPGCRRAPSPGVRSPRGWTRVCRGGRSGRGRTDRRRAHAVTAGRWPCHPTQFRASVSPFREGEGEQGRLVTSRHRTCFSGTRGLRTCGAWTEPLDHEGRWTGAALCGPVGP